MYTSIFDNIRLSLHLSQQQKMKIKLILIIMLAFVIKLNGQAPSWAWAKSGVGGGEDWGKSIVVDAIGNSYVTGCFLSTSITLGSFILSNAGGGQSDIFIAKYDPSGNVIWAKKAGGIDPDIAKSIAIDNNGNIFVSGYFASSTITFGTTTLTNVTNSIPFNTADIFVTKLDQYGNFIWANSAGGIGSDFALDVATDINGNCYLTGWYSDSISFDSFTFTKLAGLYIVKYDVSGNVVWAKEESGNMNSDWPGSITVDQNGSFYLTGFFQSDTINFGNYTLVNSGSWIYHKDFFVVKYNNNGNVMWAKSAMSWGNEEGIRVKVDNNGNVYVTGILNTDSMTFGNTIIANPNGSGGSDFFIAKYDSSGIEQWAMGCGGIRWDKSKDIAIDALGNIYLTGNFESPSITFGNITLINTSPPGYANIFVVKLDPSGNSVWAIKGEGSGYQNGGGLSLDQSGNVYISGDFGGSTLNLGNLTLLNSGSYGDFFIAKLDATVGIPEQLNFYNGISISPNPTSSTFTLTTNTPLSNPQIIIYNTLGEIVYSEKTNTTSNTFSKQLNLNTPSGVYIIKLTNNPLFVSTFAATFASTTLALVQIMISAQFS